jgi:secretion/DNA translocation related CpaE-like protein
MPVRRGPRRSPSGSPAEPPPAGSPVGPSARGRGDGPGEDDPPAVVLICGDDALAQRLGTLAAVAGATLDRPTVPWVGRRVPASLARAPLVLVGADVLDAGSRGHPPGLREVARRDAVVVVAATPAEPDLWRLAVEVGADHVALLPDAEPWLLDRLVDAAAGPAGGRVVGVVGGRGGAGASTLAVTLALASVRRRLRTVLVDGDPLGGGLDLLLGAEELPGLRWPDLADVRGRLQPGLLVSGCVSVDGVHLVSWGAGPVCARAARSATATSPAGRADAPGPSATADAVRAVLGAAVREADLVVVDLPRALGPAETAALDACDLVLLVVPAEIRAAASAARLGDAVAARVADLRLVVRGPAPSGLPAEAVADLLGLPLAAALPAEPGIAAVLDRGEAAAVRPRGALARFAARVVAEVVAG